MISGLMTDLYYIQSRNSYGKKHWYKLCLLCVCVTSSPEWAIWKKYEVVEFHPWSVIATVLDSVTF